LGFAKKVCLPLLLNPLKTTAMKLTKSHIRLIQNELNKMGLNAGKVDGIAGKNTKSALLKVPGNTGDWPFKMQAIAFIQTLCKQNGIETGKIDGKWGPQTDFAYGVLVDFLRTGTMPGPWRDEQPVPEVNPNNWPLESNDSLTHFYGEVGKNQVRLQLPYPHRIAWDKRIVVHSIFCHEKVKDSLNRVLTKVLEHYGLDEIKRLHLDIWGGCLNVRKKRGGSTWSTHSWGIALDYDPENNALRWGRDRAEFARPEYDKWWQFWEEEGWVSLGRTKNFDWMHVQAARKG
jgi:hypothetical protein